MLGLRVTFTANIYTPLNRGMVLLQLYRWQFSHKKLCSRHYSIELEFLFTKTTNSLFEPLFGGLRGNVRTSSIAHWKARGDFLFVIIEHFSISLTVQTS